jgi:hypothetical protein
MRFAMIFGGDWRGHVHDSFDEFGVVDMRHLLVAPLELVAREPVARPKRRDPFGGSPCPTHFNTSGHDARSDG